MNRHRWSPAIAILITFLLLYWAISLRNLAVVPPVYEDEPWQASTGWKLAQQGIFGSDMFHGYYGMERHYYGYMPIHPLLLAVVFKAGGVGLFQARFEPVLMGLLGLALTFALGRRLFGPGVGLLAVWLLLFTRTSGLTPSQVSGILWLDFARIARYDMVVPVFGLASLHSFWTAVRLSTPRHWRYGLAGLLAGLAGLSHLYGLFWMVALVGLAIWQRSGRRALGALLLGFSLPWLPYLVYLLSALPDWQGQTREYAPRFELFNPRWYLTNLWSERQRYGPGLGSPGLHYLLRPGFWTAATAVPLSLLVLGRRALAGQRRAMMLFVPAVLLPLLFALLIYLELANYLVTIVPLLALAAAWGAACLWQRTYKAWPSFPAARRYTRVLLAVTLLAVTVEGAARITALRAAAATPYADFIGQVERCIPAGGRVLGMHHYWFGLEEYDYRTWAVPLLQRNSRHWSPPLPVGQALDNIGPEVILIDRRMRTFFADDPVAAGEIEEWMMGQGFVLTAVVDDPTYGRIEIYQVGQ